MAPGVMPRRERASRREAGRNFRKRERTSRERPKIPVKKIGRDGKILHPAPAVGGYLNIAFVLDLLFDGVDPEGGNGGQVKALFGEKGGKGDIRGTEMGQEGLP